MNALPLVLLLVGVAIAALVPATAGGRIATFIAWLYLAPPLLCRLLLAAHGRPSGRFTQDTTGYRIWWTATQLQMPFNRLPFLEELLRLVPGLYPLWIRLWGGAFSLQAYAAPGVVITDRWLVSVGRGVVLGAQSAISSHAGLRDEAGRWVVELAEPVVEDHAILGAQSGLGPGARIRRGAMFPAGRKLGLHMTFPRDILSTKETAA